MTLWILLLLMAGSAGVLALGVVAVFAGQIVGRRLLERLRAEHVEWWTEAGQPWWDNTIRPYRSEREAELSRASSAARCPTPDRGFLSTLAVRLPDELTSDVVLVRLWSSWRTLYWFQALGAGVLAVWMIVALAFVLI